MSENIEEGKNNEEMIYWNNEKKMSWKYNQWQMKIIIIKNKNEKKKKISKQRWIIEVMKWNK